MFKIKWLFHFTLFIIQADIMFLSAGFLLRLFNTDAAVVDSGRCEQ